MDISVIIPAYNASETLSSCLDTITSQKMPPKEIILVDDCSIDETVEIASRYDTVIVSSDSNEGPAVARNKGADVATGEILLFLDADVTVPPDLTYRIHEILSEFPGIAAVQTIYSPVCEKVNLVSVYQNFYYHYALAHLDSKTVAIFATWCAAIRRSDFFAVGGFNTRIPEPTVEDEELGYALADAGRSIFLASDIQVVHHAGYSLSQFCRRRSRMATAQAKSGWRSIKERLLRRYINIRETGTHHSRWVVLSILLVMVSALLLFVSAFSALAGIGNRVLLITSAFSILILSQLCHTRFYRNAVSYFGFGVLPRFIPLCILDMSVLGWGILKGTVQFISGRHY